MPAAVEEDAPAAEQDNEAAAGKVAVDAQVAEVRRPHLHVLLVLGQGMGLPSVWPRQGSVTIGDWSC